MNSKLIGVGVGPGDPELLTLKAVKLIQSSSVLAYAANAEGYSYARQIAAAYIQPGQVEIPLPFSMNRDRKQRRAARAQAIEQILAVLRKGQDVVFITEGDPLLYSTFQHLLALLPEGFSVEICPGISAMCAASAAAGFSLAIEDQLLIVAPAGQALGHLNEWLEEGKCLALFKVAPFLKELASEVRYLKFPYRAILIERVSTAEEKITSNLIEWENRDVSYFSIALLCRRGEPEKKYD